MKSRSALVFCIGLFAMSIVLSGESAKKEKHLLVVDYTAEFHHDSIPTGEQVIAQLGQRSGLFTVDDCRTAADVKTMLTPDNLKKYDAVFFNNTTGDLGIPDLHAFLAWIKAGHAFIGIHAASDTYHPSQIGGDASYVDMLGGEFMIHGAQCEVDCIVQDPNFPACKALGTKDWKIYDEIYLFKQNNRDKVHVLLHLDKFPNNGMKQAGQPGDYLISWCKMYGKGRVFYCALGHRKEVWLDKSYQDYLLGGIKWALGLARGSAEPGPILPSSSSH
jgi:hypothetical protein